MWGSSPVWVVSAALQVNVDLLEPPVPPVPTQVSVAPEQMHSRNVKIDSLCSRGSVWLCTRNADVCHNHWQFRTGPRREKKRREKQKNKGAMKGKRIPSLLHFQVRAVSYKKWFIYCIQSLIITIRWWHYYFATWRYYFTFFFLISLFTCVIYCI